MRALQLVTTPRSFFEQQVRALERAGVRCTTLPVHRTVDGAGRSLADYLRFYPKTLERVAAGYDVVHANHGLTAPFALAQPTRPVVLTFWGSDLMGERTTVHRLVRRAGQLNARLADAVILPSRALADHLGVDHALVPFGVDTERFRPMSRDEARERVGWEPDGRYALFPYDPARPEKDFPLAERVAERAGVELRTVTSVSHDEMPAYLNASDAVLVTSRHESGPMVVKEAAACNVPVVSTDVGFVSDVLDGVTNSAVCDEPEALADALERIVESGERADGRETITGLDVEAMGRALRRVYDRALEGR